ncbi:MAG: ABC transporter ATP-binding protein [Oscillospiraceae bacterium]|nr:ABC transporter ATP-binding protein [Oscillospiraceae bacterium]
MLRLLKYLRNNKAQSVIAPLFKFIEAVFELLVPVIMAQIIDVGVANGDKEYILKRGAVLVLFGVLGLACALTAQYFAAKASFGFGTALRSDLYRHFTKLSYAEIDKTGASTLINRLTSDINLAQSAVNMFLRLFMRAPFIVVGSIIMSLTINVKLTLIFLVATPLLSAAIYFIMHASLPKYKQIQKNLDSVTLSVRENLSGARVIRAFSAQDREEKRFFDETEKLERSQLAVGKISALLNPITYVIVYAAIIVIIWCGGLSVNVGDLTQGNLIALVSYMTQILLALVAFANLIVIVTKGTASAARVADMLEVKASVTDDNASDTQGVKDACAVELKNVSFAYESSDENAVSDISFKLEAGQTLGIIGGTGSGKSTLVNLIPRFYDATKGEVLIDGVNVKEYKFDTLRDKIGVVPQKAQLFSGTIRDNIKWGNENATDEQVWEALTLAQAEEFVRAKQGGLDEMIAQGGKNLSGGQRQRLTIARALVKKPHILILDDSASALDMATDAKLRKAVSQLPYECAVIIVSQRAATIKNADKILVIDDGECVGLGSHSELMQSCEIYREICQSQLSEKEGGDAV